MRRQVALPMSYLVSDGKNSTRQHKGVVMGGERLQDPSDAAKGEAESRSNRLVVVLLRVRGSFDGEGRRRSQDTTAPPPSTA